MITDKLRRRALRVPQPADVRTGGERPWDLSVRRARSPKVDLAPARRCSSTLSIPIECTADGSREFLAAVRLAQQLEAGLGAVTLQDRMLVAGR